MFEKILIANRGEIACRVMRTAKRLGIKTVAVYSEADASALHVAMADEAIAIGASPAAESYLVIDKILEACKASGAQAVHPGFGFLSENPAFVAALDAAGVAFIGPPTNAIKAMGDKIESKRLAAEASVSTVPGHMDLIEDADEAVKIATGVGYPVMIKASAGGGGKGMRVAYNDEEAREGFRSARNEAISSFADDRIFIEKFVEEPRHIEIQVLADKAGKTLHLGERECSIQRRHQKVIEEAPSPFLDDETRAAMGAQAIALAAAVDYHSAGTVEFIVDKNKNFYFLEMNTRIQVEHPVTEMITGLDLVEWMIRIAAGEPLNFEQEDVRLSGWSLESRVYAEDPLRNFLPSIGRLVRYSEPTARVEPGTQVRVDSGVVEGSDISMFYDPMIAKLVTHGPDRATAIAAMRRALDSFHIRGVGNNLNFLSAVMEQPKFIDGQMTTNFIAESYPDGFQGLEVSDTVKLRLAIVGAILQRIRARRESEIDGQMPSRGRRPVDDWVVMIGDDNISLTLTRENGDYQVRVGEADHSVSCDWEPGDALFHATLDGQAITVQVDRRGPSWLLSHAGANVEVLALTARVAELADRMPRKEPPDLSKFLLSPMPGLLVSLAVAEGHEVKAGNELAVVEAMKMENVLRAERDGVVGKIHVDAGASLAVDQVILEFE